MSHDSNAPEPPPLGTRAQVDVAALSHKGYLRANNEDHYLVSRFGRFLEPLLSNMRELVPNHFEELGYAMVVADGMGGAAGGEIASALAIASLANLCFETPDWIFGQTEPELERIMERMAHRYRRVDALLKARARADEALAGMGTTLTLAGNVGPNLILVHVGDSRAYLFRAGHLRRLTRDHTLVQQMLDLGLVTAEDQIAKPLRHALTNVLGGGEQPCTVDVHKLGLANHDKVLLCTDGLTNMVDDATIERALASPEPANKTCAALVDAALANGGKDNVTVALANYRFVFDL
jgi:serine/threonine protein phosphatase PrpC